MAVTRIDRYICDACGRTLENIEERVYPELSTLRISVPDSGWIWVGGKLYCNKHDISLKTGKLEEVVLRRGFDDNLTMRSKDA